MGDELFDILDEEGRPTGQTKPRRLVHRDGDWHRAVHVWLYVMRSDEFLVQQRSTLKDSWPGKWDISAAGHLSAGQASLEAAERETYEELGVQFPKNAFEPIFSRKASHVENKGTFVDNEFNDVYLVTIRERIPEAAFVLDEAEVDAVRYISPRDLEAAYRRGDPAFVSADIDGPYGQLFDIVKARAARKGLPGSGIFNFFHDKPGHQPVEVQCLTFDEPYLKLVPAMQR